MTAQVMPLNMADMSDEKLGRLLLRQGPYRR